MQRRGSVGGFPQEIALDVGVSVADRAGSAVGLLPLLEVELLPMLLVGEGVLDGVKSMMRGYDDKDGC